MLKRIKDQKKSKLPLSQRLFPACQNPQRENFFQKYPSHPPLVVTVGSDIPDDVDTPESVDYVPSDQSPNHTDSPPGSIFSNASYATDRFFIPNADVASGSLIEEARLMCSVSRERSKRTYGTPVEVHSRDPIGDFRRSMEEMLEAYHVERGESLDGEPLEELLYAYLELNERTVYRYIFAAFFDLAVELRYRP